MVMPEYPLRTARLALRPYAPDDLDALHDIQSRPEVTRYLLFDARNRDQARKSLAEKIQATGPDGEGGSLTLAVVLPETGDLIGEALLFFRSREHALGEIGYMFHPDHAGHGYATEAARVMLRLGFEEYGLHRIVGRLDALVLLGDAAINQTLDAGVGHAAVAGQTVLRIGLVDNLGGTAGRGAVDEAAVVDFARPRLVVVLALEVLAAAYEDRSLLKGRIVLWHAGRDEGVKKELSIRQIRS